MDLFLMQHGQSLPKEEDPQQGLSPQGQAQAASTARALKKMGLHLDLILASPKQRSGQTAEIVAQALGYPAGDIEVSELVKAMAPPSETLALLASRWDRRRVLIAGHLPHLAELVSLLTAPSGGVELALVNAGVGLVELPRAAPGAGRLRWYLPPDLAEALLA